MDALRRSLSGWFDASASDGGAVADKVDWIRCIPFLAMHAACLGVLWVGWSPVAVGVAAALYLVRMFSITGFYHRYFSHRTFSTSRWFQFVMALWGGMSGQRGALWWAAHHRHHHRHSDQEEDLHSPHRHSFLWSHMLWFMTPYSYATDETRVRDLAKYPELRWLNRYDWVPPLALLAAMAGLGAALGAWAPSLGTSAAQMVVWGFFISTIVLFHGTCLINSMAHLWGRKRYRTGDESRNSLLLSLITLGEGWHNNHHYYPGTVRQGFYWWELDITYYCLWLMSKAGLIWDLRPVPSNVIEEGRRGLAVAGAGHAG